LLVIEKQNYLIELPYGPIRFRTTIVKPFRELLLQPEQKQEQDESPKVVQNKKPQLRDPDIIVINIPNTFHLEHKYDNINMYKSYNTFLFIIFLSTKKESDLKLLLKLRKNGLIKTFGILFEISQKQEIENLIIRGIFSF
jgi:hypothetical protein